jgi:hypothetical protein
LLSWGTAERFGLVLTRLTLIRAGTLAIVVAAWCVAVFGAPLPKKLPGPALGSEFLWRAEVAFGVVLALLFVFVVVVRGWRGDLPNTFSDKGAGWPEVAEATEEALASMRGRLDKIQAQIDALAEEVAILGEGR